MINKVLIRNLGPLARIDWPDLGPINLIIGGNDTGKTFLLKILYTVMRTIEAYKRGDEKKTAAEILAQRLYWTFQPEKIGDLVNKSASAPASFSVLVDQRKFECKFGKDTTRQVNITKNTTVPRESNSLFFPAKEVLSLHHIILKSREQDSVYGFDDTYLDLARALRQAPKKGKNYPEFSESRQSLNEMLGGRIEFDDASQSWQFKKGNQKFSIGVTAEGIKKLAILDTLLGNRYLDRDSLIFIDEPESALHPTAVSQLLEIIAALASRGIQFFLASHSYFVLKKLYLIAHEKDMSIPIIAAGTGGWQYTNLREEMPDNSIIDESIQLYRDELELTLK